MDTNLEGKVDEGCVEITETSLWIHAWYHGRISRVSAYTMLRPRDAGTFLVRKSNDNENFTLQVKGRKNVFNWRVMVDSNSKMLSIEDNKRFHTIAALIEHYTSSRDVLEKVECPLRSYAERAKPQLREENEWEISR